MEILQIIGIGLVCTVLVVVLRQTYPEMAMLLALACGLGVLGLLLGRLSGVLTTMSGMAERANLPTGYLSAIIKVIGVAYLAEFGVQICKDAGAGSMAMKIELGGKLVILAMAAPIMASLVELIAGMLR